MSDNKFTTKYELKQHTMLLHFQDESDACLRASEVKPKLDRFIVKKLEGKENLKKDNPTWIQAEHRNGKDVALKYRMTIKRAPEARPIKYGASNLQNKIPKIFYGNMSGGSNNSNKKIGVFFINETDESSLILTITCFDKDLKSCIDKNIAEFFAVTNFGTMQSKGFGSFTVMGKECDIAKTLKEYYGATHCYKINMSNCDDVQNEAFETIKQVYSIMKSGSRRPFDHAYIYQYMHDSKRGNIGNEKAAMKKRKVSPALGREGMGGFSETFQYVRAVLGLGSALSYITDNPNPAWYVLDNEQITFQRDGTPITRFTNQNGRYIVKKFMKENIEITHVKDDNGTDYPTDSKEKIDRFQSPIMFKIVENQVYIVASRIDKDVLGKYFTFENDSENRTSREGLRYRRNRTNGKVVLQVPKSFDIDDFMESFVDYYNKIYLTKTPRPAKTQEIEVAI